MKRRPKKENKDSVDMAVGETCETSESDDDDDLCHYSPELFCTNKRLPSPQLAVEPETVPSVCVHELDQECGGREDPTEIDPRETLNQPPEVMEDLDLEGGENGTRNVSEEEPNIAVCRKSQREDWWLS